MKKIFFISIIVCAGYLFAQDLSVTVYNQNIGVIRDVRSLNISKGNSKIAVTDVAQFIDPTTVHIKLNGDVIEQNYQYDLVSLDKILSKYIDKEINLISESGEIISGTLLSTASGQAVIRKKDNSLVMLPNLSKYRFNVEALPEGLITRPTLIWNINSNSSGKQDVELSYQTGGMNWHTEYVAVLNDNDTKTDLQSWVSIENNSGASYKNAKLKLVAGDINLIQNMPNLRGGITDQVMYKQESVMQFQEKSFFEYHVYDLQRNADVMNNETKQISLFDAKNIAVTKKYLYKSGFNNYYSNNSQSKVAVVIQFDNKESNNLGMPLPKGKVRLYKKDGDALTFLGEDAIDHTPKNETVKLRIGDAFDIVAEEVQTDNKKISDRVYETSWSITLKNRKTENVTVEVEKFIGYLWEVTKSSIPSEKKDANTILFKVPVGKDSETKLTFTVRYSY